MATCYCPVVQSQTAGPGVALTMGVVIPTSLCGSKDSAGKYVDYCSSAYTWNSGPAQMSTVILALVPGDICAANSFP